MGHMTIIMPFSGMVCCQWVETSYHQHACPIWSLYVCSMVG